MKLKDDIKDWILPALLLTPHTVLLMAIWLDKPSNNKFPIERLLESSAYLATITGLVLAVFAYKSWKNPIIAEKNIIQTEKAIELLIDLEPKIENLWFSINTLNLYEKFDHLFIKTLKESKTILEEIKPTLKNLDNLSEQPLINPDLKKQIKIATIQYKTLISSIDNLQGLLDLINKTQEKLRAPRTEADKRVLNAIKKELSRRTQESIDQLTEENNITKKPRHYMRNIQELELLN